MNPYIRKIVNAIAVSDCSSSSNDKIFTRDEIRDFSEVTLNILQTDKTIFNCKNGYSLLLIEYYLNVLLAETTGSLTRTLAAQKLLNFLPLSEKEKAQQQAQLKARQQKAQAQKKNL